MVRVLKWSGVQSAWLGCAGAMLAAASTVAATSPVDTASAAGVHQPQADSIATRLIGTWKLIEIRDRDAAGVETPAQRGAAGGQLLYAANGRLSVQIIRAGRELAPAGGSDGFSSYFGTWKLVPLKGYVIHVQEGNLNLAQTGQAAKRYYSFDAAGHLSLATPPAKREDGRMLSTVFVWERYP